MAAAELLASETRALITGRDMREHSATLQAAFNEGVIAAGVDVVDIGLVATDQLYYATGAEHLPGAVFTPSHNPSDYGGVKFSRIGALPVGLESGLAGIRDRAVEVLTSGLRHREGTNQDAASRTVADTLPGYAAKLADLVDLSGHPPVERGVSTPATAWPGSPPPAVFRARRSGCSPSTSSSTGPFRITRQTRSVPANLVDLQAECAGHGGRRRPRLRRRCRPMLRRRRDPAPRSPPAAIAAMIAALRAGPTSRSAR